MPIGFAVASGVFSAAVEMHTARRLGRGVLGDSLGALRDSVLGKLTRKYKSDGRLDLSGGDSGSLGVSGKLSSLDKGSLEDVGDE